MLATVLEAPGEIHVEELPDPTILTPGDAIIRVAACCVCGSDLWPYRGIEKVTEPRKIGHEAIGVVEQVGEEVKSVKPGDFVIVPFSFSCGKCQACRNGCDASCDHVAFAGSEDADGNPSQGGCQASKLRVGVDADHTLFPIGLTEAEVKERGLTADLLALSDVMSTGYHAAVAAQVKPGDVVAVIGDGAVGLCAVIAAKLLGAKRIVAFSRHADRAALAREFGATDVLAERGDAAAPALRILLGGDLADVALECVGTKESFDQALDVVRGGGRIGYVGVPHGVPGLDVGKLFGRNIQVGGGMASARRHMETLLPYVLRGEIHPGKVFDLELPLTEAAQAYQAMDQRKAIKVLLRP